MHNISNAFAYISIEKFIILKVEGPNNKLVLFACFFARGGKISRGGNFNPRGGKILGGARVLLPPPRYAPVRKHSQIFPNIRAIAFL